MILRTCGTCGLNAITESDLELFEKDSHSEHGRRNRCKSCTSRRKNGPAKEKTITCQKCYTRFSVMESIKAFRRTKPTGGKVIGELSRICKSCELSALIECGEEFIEIDGRLIPANIKDRLKGSRITTVPLSTY